MSGEVVFIDDSRQLAEIAGAMLKRLGCRVSVFSDPEQACAYVIANAERIFMMISDQSMPALTGIDIARKLQPLPNRPHTVLATSVFDAERLADYQANGIDAILPKPFALDDLARLLERFCAAAD